MPRTTKVKAEEGEVVQRAPRRTVAKRATRTSTKKVADSTSTKGEEAVVVRRKAPTRTVITEATVTLTPQKREKSLYVSGALFGFGLLAATLIGYSDEGQINPATVIAERNARLTAGVAAADGDSSSAQVIPVQNTSTEKNGGLIRSTTPREEVPAPIETVSTSSATTTDTVASSTTAVTEDEGEAEEVTDQVVASDEIVETEPVQ